MAHPRACRALMPRARSHGKTNHLPRALDLVGDSRKSGNLRINENAKHLTCRTLLAQTIVWKNSSQDSLECYFFTMKLEAGQGGILGHSNMSHWEYTEVLKAQSRKKRRWRGKQEIRKTMYYLGSG